MENYLLNYDVTTGNILGFYLKSINENIPIPTIEITPEKHDFYMQNNGLYRVDPTTLEDKLIPIVVIIPPPSESDRIKALEQAMMMLI